MTTPVRLFWNYFFQMASLGVFLPFFSLYAHALGFSFFEISLLTLSIPVIQLVSPPLYGWLADLYLSRNTLFRFSLVVPLLLSPLFYLSHSFPVLFLLIMIFGISRSPANSLLNAATMEILGDEAERFGQVRLAGSLGCIVFVIAEGFWLKRFGVEHFPDLMILGLFLSFLMGIRTDLPQGKRLTQRQAQGELKKAITDPLWVLFLLGISFHWGASQSFNLFFTTYLEKLSYPSSLSGILWALAILSETAAFFISKGILRVTPLVPVIQLAALAATGRWLATAFWTTPLGFAIVQLSHGITFGLFYAAMILWVHKHSPAGLSTTMQGMAHGIMFGIGGGAGQLLSGYILDYGSGKMMFLGSALLNFLALLCFLLLSRMEERRLPEKPHEFPSKLQSAEGGGAVLSPIEVQGASSPVPLRSDDG